MGITRLSVCFSATAHPNRKVRKKIRLSLTFKGCRATTGKAPSLATALTIFETMIRNDDQLRRYVRKRRGTTGSTSHGATPILYTHPLRSFYTCQCVSPRTISTKDSQNRNVRTSSRAGITLEGTSAMTQNYYNYQTTSQIQIRNVQN